MYFLARMFFALTIMMLAYCLGLCVLLFWPMSAWVCLGFGFYVITRKTYQRFTTLGSAAFASLLDLLLAEMINSRSGLIIGRVYESLSLWGKVRAIFNGRLNAKEACTLITSGKKGHLVRLPCTTVHVLVTAPTGVGKGVSCIIPFLQTCTDSCVVVDFKGENALKTAYLRQKMGHEVIILDPWKVVTE